MVVNADGELPLPWLAAPLAQALAAPGHALLLHAAPGSGALALALSLAQARLCEGEREGEGTAAPRPCGRCGSCRLVHSRLHPDLFVLLPQTLRREHGWLLVDDRPDADDSKRKPSRQIRIDEVRALIDWSTMTSARGRGKVAVLHPAEALNLQSANALLKTLEEPPPGTRLVLTCTDPALLLPTVLSRCQRQRLAEPPLEQAAAWLAGQGVADLGDAQVLLAACSGRPLEALALVQAGVDAAAWAALPAAIAAGQAGVLAGWPLPRALDTLHKLCHDALACASGASPRFFPAGRVPPHGQPALLSAWAKELDRVARNDEHPWHELLLIEALVRQAAQALAPAPAATRRTGSRLATLPAP